MPCSGITIGTRNAVPDYLNILHRERSVWRNDPKCNSFKINGDDQSMHNYLYYSGMLLDKIRGGFVAVQNRNGIVHTAGATGGLIVNHLTEQKRIFEKELKQNSIVTTRTRLSGAAELEKTMFTPTEQMVNDNKNNHRNWLGTQFGLTDAEGYFVDFDGSRSFVVHQYDRFGPGLNSWMTLYAL